MQIGVRMIDIGMTQRMLACGALIGGGALVRYVDQERIVKRGGHSYYSPTLFSIYAFFAVSLGIVSLVGGGVVDVLRWAWA